MRVQNITPNPFLYHGVKLLPSNDNMLTFFKKFCDAITSRIWKNKKPRNWRYTDIDFLEVFFFSEIMGRSIHDCSEMLNEHQLSQKKRKTESFHGRT